MVENERMDVQHIALSAPGVSATKQKVCSKKNENVEEEFKHR